jgi:hypothetical protein
MLGEFGPPKLTFATVPLGQLCVLFCATYWKPAMMVDTSPLPSLSRTLTAYSFVFLATPYVLEPIVPATWVPCPYPSVLLFSPERSTRKVAPKMWSDDPSGMGEGCTNVLEIRDARLGYRYQSHMRMYLPQHYHRKCNSYHPVLDWRCEICPMWHWTAGRAPLCGRYDLLRQIRPVSTCGQYGMAKGFLWRT